MSWKARYCLILFGISTLVGCSKGPTIAEVEGTLKLDGKPVPNVRIMFMPDPQKGTVGAISCGFSDEQGHFTLTYEDERPGAVVGWHKVVLLNGSINLYRTPRNGRRDDDDPVLKIKPKAKTGPKVPEKYATAAKTPMEMEVKPTKNALELLLTH
jgi:hypothetical protein